MDKGIIALTFASIISLFILSDLAWNKYQSELINHVDSIAKSDDNCQLNVSACEASFQIIDESSHLTQTTFKTVKLSIDPNPIPLLKPFNLKVKAGLDRINKVVVEFKGKEMDMGPNQTELALQKDGYYTGQGVLPICTIDTMNWVAQVYIQTDKKLFLSQFNFVTHNKVVQNTTVQNTVSQNKSS